MNALMSLAVWPVLLLPLLAALVIGGAMLGGRLRQGQGEDVTARLALGAIYLSALFALALPGIFVSVPVVQQDIDFTWLRSGSIEIGIGVVTGGMHGRLALLFALLFVVVFRFARPYMHGEAGFHRFFFFLCLFTFAMFLLVLAANALLGFLAWELAGVSSWFLIAYSWQRTQAAANATRVFLIQRTGDAGFLLALTLMLLWTGSADWYALPDAVGQLGELQLHLLALAFLLPAFVKSAQFPFTHWLFRAMEGPTPSSAVFYGAVMIHAGVFLVILLQPLLERSFVAMLLLVLVGALSTLYGLVIGRSQTDIKSSLACATVSQTGLMFVECGLGLWTLALWHMGAHAIVRCFLFLRSPSILHNAHDLPLQPTRAPARWLQAASLQQGWLDQLQDWAIVRPVQRLARDLAWFEARILDPLLGTPAPVVRRVATLLQQEEGRIGARLDNEQDAFAHGSGLAGKLTGLVAALSDWFEQRFILQGVGRDLISAGRYLGHAANRFEQLLLRPRYLVLFMLITLLVAL